MEGGRSQEREDPEIPGIRKPGRETSMDHTAGIIRRFTLARPHEPRRECGNRSTAQNARFHFRRVSCATLRREPLRKRPRTALAGTAPCRADLRFRAATAFRRRDAGPPLRRLPRERRRGPPAASPARPEEPRRADTAPGTPSGRCRSSASGRGTSATSACTRGCGPGPPAHRHRAPAPRRRPDRPPARPASTARRSGPSARTRRRSAWTWSADGPSRPARSPASVRRGCADLVTSPRSARDRGLARLTESP
ncbi:hypothetical protein SUDANB6_03401 [Streptomyces sp. enrichment culture]